MLLALEPEEGKAKFYLEVLLLHKNDCELFLTENWELLVVAGGFLFLVAFNILLQNGKYKYKERIQRQNNNPEVIDQFTVRNNYS